MTDRREREQRLSLLNRFLVDTVSARMDAVAEDANAVASEPGDGTMQQRGASIWATTTNLITLLNHVREIERGLATDDEQRSDVGTVVRQVADSVATGAGQPAVVLDEEPVYVRVEPPLLESTLDLLVTDGVQTPPALVTLAVTCDEDTVDITVVLAESEREGTELEELAVQLARLTIEAAGGSVAVNTAPSEQRPLTCDGQEGASEHADGAWTVENCADTRITVSLPAANDADVMTSTNGTTGHSSDSEERTRNGNPKRGERS